jgi:hypothetical protein
MVATSWDSNVSDRTKDRWESKAGLPVATSLEKSRLDSACGHGNGQHPEPFFLAPCYFPIVAISNSGLTSRPNLGSSSDSLT